LIPTSVIFYLHSPPFLDFILTLMFYFRLTHLPVILLVILLLTITLISSWCSGPELIDIIFMIKIDLFQMLLTAIIYSSVKYRLPPIMIFDYFHLAGLGAHVLVLFIKLQLYKYKQECLLDSNLCNILST
jgi:hypothetical protein